VIPAELLRFLREPKASDDKYSRGVVGFITGSEQFPGAAILGVTAAMRTGIGMVRYLGPRAVGELLIQVRPEAVLSDGRAQAWVFGSGVPEVDPQVAVMQAHFEKADLAVIDAGALFSLDLSKGNALAVLTPHAGELARLLGVSRSEVEENPAHFAEQAAKEFQCAVLLKGNTTHICSPKGEVVAVTNLSSALSTAGTGDVLAGILGALLAANFEAASENSLMEIIELAVRLHSSAADLAAQSGPIVALDVAEAVRQVISDIHGA